MPMKELNSSRNLSKFINHPILNVSRDNALGERRRIRRSVPAQSGPDPEPSSLRLCASPPLPCTSPALPLLGAPATSHPFLHRAPLPPPAVLGGRHPHLPLRPLLHLGAGGLSCTWTTCHTWERGPPTCCRLKDILFRRPGP